MSSISSYSTFLPDVLPAPLSLFEEGRVSAPVGPTLSFCLIFFPNLTANDGGAATEADADEDDCGRAALLLAATLPKPLCTAGSMMSSSSYCCCSSSSCPEVFFIVLPPTLRVDIIRRIGLGISSIERARWTPTESCCCA